MSTVDALILATFVAYAIRVGLRNRLAASRNLEEYFLAGRSLPGWKAGLSMAATQFAADTPLLVTGIIATAGVFGLWQFWIFGVTFLLMGFVLAGAWRRAGVVTDAEFTEVRYSAGPAALLRCIKAFYFGTVINCIALAWVLFAAAKISEPFLLWNEWLPEELIQPIIGMVEVIGVPMATSASTDLDVWVKTTNNLLSLVMILGVVAFYSTTGGLRSVVATDVVQLGVMLLGTLVFAVIVVKEIGGLQAMTARVYEIFDSGGGGAILPSEILAFTPGLAKDVTPTALSVLGMLWLINSVADGSGYLAQRSMACRSDRDARTAAVVFTFTQVLVRSLLWLPLGIGLLVLFPPDPELGFELIQADRETTYVRGMAELLPAGVLGLMLTGMLAALASTVDTHLNWGASYWTNDIYKRFICQAWLKIEPSGPSLVWVARLSNFLILGVALVVMTKLTSINQAWQINLLFGAGLGVVLVLRWVWWRMNAWAEIAAMLVSCVVAPALIFFFDDSQQSLRLLLVALTSTTAALVAIWATGPEDQGRIQDFYRRVRPPGFWGQAGIEVEGRDGVSILRLGRGVGAMLICSVSVYCLLVGLGSWLVGSPPPAWLPSRSVWVFGLVSIGVLLIPIWYHLGYGKVGREPRSKSF